MMAGKPKPLVRNNGKKRKSYNKNKNNNNNRWLCKKIQKLTEVFNPIPFVPKLLDLQNHENVLKRLGLYKFSKLNLDKSIRKDLLVELIVSYNPKKKCSYVNGKRIRVNRADLGRALELPVIVMKEVGDEVFKDEEIGFIEDFVFNWVLLHEESWVMPVELENWTRCVREGSPEKLDAASLVWYKVDKELSRGVNLGDCYYASHLQRLIRVQHAEFFVEAEENVEQDGIGLTLGPHVREDDEFELMVEEHVNRKDDLGNRCPSSDLETKVEHEEKEEMVSIVKEDETLGLDVGKIVHEDVREDDETMVDAEERKEDEEVEVEKTEQVTQKTIVQHCQRSGLETKVEKVVDEHEENEETLSTIQENSVELTFGADVAKIVHDDVDETMVDGKEEVIQEHVNRNNGLVDKIFQKEEQENAVELTLGPDVGKIVHQNVKGDNETMVETEECKEEVEKMEKAADWNNVLGERILQRCQSSDMNNYEETKAEEVVQVDEMEEQVYCNNGLGVHIFQHCQSSELNNYEGSKVEEVANEQIELVDNDDKEKEGGERFVGGFEMEANDDLMDRDELNDHIRYTSHGIDISGSRDDSFMSRGCPSFFGKRVLQPEHDMHHLDGNSKRFKTNEMWEPKQNDFDSCMVQMQQWVEKARMIKESSEARYVNSKYHQDAAINQLQERNQIMENIIKSKDQELVQKHAEVFRLERELYLMGDLVAEYRKASYDTRFKFAEYRKRVALQEEPLYKDVGAGGLVLSTRELERQHLTQEEYKMKIQTCFKSYEEGCVNDLKILGERVVKLADKLVFLGNEATRLKEMAARCKETRKPRDELELSPESEEEQKSYDEVRDNDASMKSFLPDIHESKERVGSEEH